MPCAYVAQHRAAFRAEREAIHARRVLDAFKDRLLGHRNRRPAAEQYANRTGAT